MRRWLTLVTIAVVVPLPLCAQRIAPPPSASPLMVQTRTESPVDTRTGERVVGPTHWKTGFVVGTVFGSAFWLAALAAGGGGDFSVGDGIVTVGLGALIGGVPGALIGGLFPKGPSVRQTIRGPVPSAVTTGLALEGSQVSMKTPDLPPTSLRRSGNWKGAILLGAIAGTAFGVSVATQAGDQGSDRPFSNRLSDGIVAGAMLAVPVTVIFAILTSDGS